MRGSDLKKSLLFLAVLLVVVFAIDRGLGALMSYLYRNALQAAGEVPQPLFPEPPRQPALVRAFHKILDFVSGR